MILVITENGVRRVYDTNAPLKKIADAFKESESVKELRSVLSEEDFTLLEYDSGFQLNFDNK